MITEKNLQPIDQNQSIFTIILDSVGWPDIIIIPYNYVSLQFESSLHIYNVNK